MGTLPSSGWQLVFMPSYALFFYQGEKDFGSKVWGQDCLYKQSHSQCDGQSHSLTSQHLPVAHCPTCPRVWIVSPFPCSFILCIPVSNASTDSCKGMAAPALLGLGSSLWRNSHRLGGRRLTLQAVSWAPPGGQEYWTDFPLLSAQG